MFRWLRRLHRWQHNSDPLYYPDHLGIDGLLSLRSFAHKTGRIDQSHGRFRPNREDVAVETTGSRTLECNSLSRALESVPVDDVKEITVKIRTGRRRLVTIVWRCDGTGHIVVSGASPIWVRGMRGVLGDFLVGGATTTVNGRGRAGASMVGTASRSRSLPASSPPLSSRSPELS
jgi:hypothetical protein